jgi:hypothetical protein
VEGPCEHGNEPSDSVKKLVLSRQYRYLPNASFANLHNSWVFVFVIDTNVLL